MSNFEKTALNDEQMDKVTGGTMVPRPTESGDTLPEGLLLIVKRESHPRKRVVFIFGGLCYTVSADPAPAQAAGSAADGNSMRGERDA